MANLTEEQRAVQRKLVGTLNRRNAMWFEPLHDTPSLRSRRRDVGRM